MLEFKEGSLKMADKAGCPVVPVAIAHSADVLENHFPFIRRAAITIRFGEPIDLKSLPREQKSRLVLTHAQSFRQCSTIS